MCLNFSARPADQIHPDRADAQQNDVHDRHDVCLQRVGLKRVLRQKQRARSGCGGIGGGAQSALTEAGIRFYGGVSGSADAAVQALLDGSLGYDPEARCDHHDHAHGAGHTCGEHSCHS